MKDQIKTIELGAAWKRVLLLVPVALVALCVWYGVRWCIGNTMAGWLPDINAAYAAARLAPDDPQAHFTIARMRERSFLPEELPEAVERYAEAARLSPNDFRLFMELGRVRGLVGDTRGGEEALRRAVELAPSYPEPRWYLGNSLLRQGRIEEAFAELRRAGEMSHDKFLPQVIEVYWRFYNADVPSVLAAVGNTQQARVQLVEYLINLKRLDDARLLWEGFDAGQRKLSRATGEKLLLRFLEAKRFKDVLALHQEFSATDGAPSAAAPERLANGGFESAVGPPGKNPFEWQVVPLEGAQMGLDARVRQEGSRSLRIAFNATNTLTFRNISQLVTVEPQTRYRLEYYVRTEDLKGVSTLVTEIVDAAQPERVLAASQPVATGTADWQTIALDFTTPAGAQGVTMRIVSPQCAATTCPLFGKVWYDNFNLQRSGGGADTNGRRAAAGRD
ncbi:MAG TPA: carbohydrate binding domain-containing protein [Pyrinomonadaceae bacterium]|nr:carbohydrate binding domain-containing protein [Pyrinomonadaceae bacterium]